MLPQSPRLFAKVDSNLAGAGVQTLVAAAANQRIYLCSVYLEYDAPGTAGSNLTLEDGVGPYIITSFPATVAPRDLDYRSLQLSVNSALQLRNNGAAAVQVRGHVLYDLY